MEFKVSCGELSNISSQIDLENKNITANISKIEKAVEQLKTVWKDASSETYCKSLLDYVKSVSQLAEYYKTIGSYASDASKKYDEADLAATKKGRELESSYMDAYDSADLIDYMEIPSVYENASLDNMISSYKSSLEKYKGDGK